MADLNESALDPIFLSNSLDSVKTNDKNLDQSKFKPFADDKINITKTMECFGKGRKQCGK